MRNKDNDDFDKDRLKLLKDELKSQEEKHLELLAKNEQTKKKIKERELKMHEKEKAKYE